MKNTPTPHINASPSDFAPTVLMPGDPLRARFIAETYFDNPRLVNQVRGVNGYTGTYRGTPVSVMASGMGIPSIGIYSYELYHFFGIENIIRVGSCGALAEQVAVRDIIIGMSAVTNSSFGKQFGIDGAPSTADYTLLTHAVAETKARGLSHHVGTLFSSDTFYSADPEESRRYASLGALGVEMEAAGLYMTAAHARRRALAICTVSDHVLTGESLSAEARQTSFTDMMEVALGVALRMAEEKER